MMVPVWVVEVYVDYIAIVDTCLMWWIFETVQQPMFQDFEDEHLQSPDAHVCVWCVCVCEGVRVWE